MSHFSRIKTSIKNISILENVLTQLDISWEKRIVTEQNDNEFKLIIHQQNQNEVEFFFTGEEYELVTDKSFWQQSISVESFISLINQTYTSKLLNQELTNLGFVALNSVKTEHGVIDFVVEKWVK